MMMSRFRRDACATVYSYGEQWPRSMAGSVADRLAVGCVGGGPTVAEAWVSCRVSKYGACGDAGTCGVRAPAEIRAELERAEDTDRSRHDVDSHPCATHPGGHSGR